MTDSTEESAREALRGAIARKSAIVAELAEIDAAIVEAARRRDGIGLQLNSSTAHARAKAWPAQALRQGLPSLDLPAELQSELSELDGTTKQRNELHAAIEALDAQRRASETQKGIIERGISARVAEVLGARLDSVARKWLAAHAVFAAASQELVSLTTAGIGISVPVAGGADTRKAHEVRTYHQWVVTRGLGAAWDAWSSALHTDPDAQLAE